jgi:hypothetical protein
MDYPWASTSSMHNLAITLAQFGITLHNYPAHLAITHDAQSGFSCPTIRDTKGSSQELK